MLVWASLFCVSIETREIQDFDKAQTIVVVSWGSFKAWEQLMAHAGWKVISDEDQITRGLIQRNVTHLSMLGYLSFVRGK